MSTSELHRYRILNFTFESERTYEEVRQEMLDILLDGLARYVSPDRFAHYMGESALK